MKKIDDIVLMHFAEGKIKDEEIKKIITNDKELMKSVESYKKTFKALKNFGSMLDTKSKLTGTEKTQIRFSKIQEYLKNKGIKKKA